MTARASAAPVDRPWANWARNQRAVASSVVTPSSIAEVSELVVRAAAEGRRVKPIGAGHSFSAIAVPVDVQVDLENLRGLLAVDTATGTATFAAGTRLREIPALLAPHGLAMENLGDIDEQSIAGAISTGTHGSGSGFGALATQVVALTLVTGDGELLTADRRTDPELLHAVAVGLGALGIVVEVTLQCVPAFVLLAREQNEPLATLIPALHERSLQSDHLDIYWFPHTERALVKTNTRLPGHSTVRPPSDARRWFDDEFLGNTVYGALCRLGALAPQLVPTMNRLTSSAVAQREYSDRSHRVFVARRTVRFVEQEYALPAENLAEALERVRDVIDRRGFRISFPLEIRFSAGDDIWMSPANGRATGYLAVHRYFREPYAEYFAAVEEVCVALGGRPHWGKYHTLTAEVLQPSYPRFEEFAALRDRLDPQRIFSNPYLEQVLGS
ncbi:D-arabinono-1,4-lactone oxidase [Herbiconiux sp. L3-i23]|uniref:D-arabinono-1,4-lactone oxidase n=1 Tax=Herbiconiux sp. L3-i23 TaxID=2905871 RepID=UPI0020670E21|nr:D-arabinono-1,4-lactone oxidase [Herbiconiux sp. L3-i23]BDI23584.1 L-gulonolactone oxidase [Herbiconiux sp. L3-i23]